MKCNFEEFVSEALQIGIGMKRQIPVFIPDGKDQDDLSENFLRYLESIGFHIMDLRNKSYEEAVESFNLQWPNFSTVRDRTEGYKNDVKESENRLVILCGEESHPTFWGYLIGHQLLYTGSIFPSHEDVPRCVVVPDNACVAVMMNGKNFKKFPTQDLGPTCRFYTKKEEKLMLKAKDILKRQFTLLYSVFRSFHDNHYKYDETFSLSELTRRLKPLIDEKVSEYFETGEAPIVFRSFRIMIRPTQEELLYSFCFLLQFIRYSDNTETLNEIEKLGKTYSFSLHEISERVYRIDFDKTK